MPRDVNRLPRRPHTAPPGFTLIELLVVMAIITLLVSIAAPRYFHAVDNAKQSSLLSSLTVMRAAIDQFAADKDRYPDSLDELVRAGYLQAVPQDPFTGSRASWIVEAAPADGIRAGSVYDVHSGAAGLAPDGRPFSDW